MSAMNDTTPYSISPATPSDAEIFARHRALMFRDIGTLPDGDVEALFSASVPWFQRLFDRQEFVGWLVHHGQEVVAGGGIHLREMGPVAGCYRLGRWGHIANIYTLPSHRRRGLARSLVEEMLRWSEQNYLDQLTLTASGEGRPLYESLGFTPTADMKFSAQRNCCAHRSLNPPTPGPSL